MASATRRPATAAGAPEADVLGAVTAAFGVGRPVRVPEPVAEGLMNRNWRVDTDRGVFALKQVIDVDADQVCRQHRAAVGLAERGLPVPVPLALPGSGETVLELDGGLYTVVPWATGVHVPGIELTLAQAHELGGLLADLHVALRTVLPGSPASVVAPVTESAIAKGRIDRFAGHIGQRQARDEFDVFAADRLAWRRDLLERVAHLRPAEGVPQAPAGPTHGDFQHLNLLWEQGILSAVLDWDRLGVRAWASELVRSATLLFGYGDARGLDLERVAAFSAGYRSVAALADAELAEAVHRLWWERVCDFWQLGFHYERHDRGCDHLFVSASALLEWWTGHRGPVVEAFTSR